MSDAAVRALRFAALRVHRMPGVARGAGFEIRGLGPGLNVVFGPNGIGKSTTARAIEELLWPGMLDRQRGGPAPELGADVTIDGEAWSVELEGRKATWRHAGAAAPAPDLGSPELSHRYRLALAELLSAVADDDRFAASLARAAAGGFDLAAIRRELKVGERPAGRQSAQRALRDALERLRGAQSLSETLERRRVEELPQLRARQDAVRRIAARADAVAAALRRLDAGDELASASAALAKLPVDQLRACHPDDSATLRAMAARTAALEQEAHAARARLEDVERELAGRSGVEVALDAAALDELAGQLDELARSRESIRQLLEGVRARRDEASLRPLAPGQADALAAALSAVREDLDASALARESHALAGRRAAHEALRGALRPLAEVQAQAATLPTLEQMRRDLADWLAATPPLAATSPPWLAIAGLAIAAVLAAMLAILHAAGWLVFLLPIGALAFVLTRPPGDPQGPERSSMRQRVERSAARGPSGWSADAVAARLRELEVESAEAAAAQRDLATHRALEREAAALAEAESRHRASLATVEQRFGMPLPSDPGWLPLLAAALSDWQKAQREVVDVSARLAEVDRQDEALRRRLAALLAPPGAAPLLSAALAATPTALRAKARAIVARQAAEAQAESLRRELAARIEPQLAAARREHARFFAARGLEPGDESGLRALLAALPRLREAEDRRAAALSADGAAERALALRCGVLEGEPLPLGDRAALEEARRVGEAALAERDQVTAAIATIEAQLEHAESGHDVGSALEAVQECRAQLAAIREEELRSAIAGVLLRTIEQRSRAASEPEILRRARRLLAQLTRGRFELRLVADGGSPAFMVHDGVDALEKSAEQLSAGERVQMLCAVRMAFLEHDERRALPLLVDETLGTCDDERAAALMDALIATAASGRQVLYFTAQRDEAAKWKARVATCPGTHFTLVDLGAIRRGESARMAPLPIEPIPPSPIPPPEGRDHESYGAELSVPALDPFRQRPEQVHLWHVVDDPEALHSLLRHGFSTLGQLCQYRAAVGAPPPGASERVCAEAQAKARGLETLFDRWRAGRARPANDEDVLAAVSVSPTLEQGLLALLRDVRGDGSRLLAALDAGELRGWRRSRSDELRDGLRARGLLAEGVPLAREALIDEVRIALHDAVARGDVDPLWPKRAVSRILDRSAGSGRDGDRG